jgi:hypothetical protein
MPHALSIKKDQTLIPVKKLYETPGETGTKLSKIDTTFMRTPGVSIWRRSDIDMEFTLGGLGKYNV